MNQQDGGTPVLYRVFDARGTLLYIGTSMQPHKRLRAHRTQAEWWGRVANIALEHFPTRGEALDAEGKAIAAEQPLLNERRKDPALEILLSVRLDRERLAAFREIARRDNRSMMGEIRHLIDERIRGDERRAA